MKKNSAYFLFLTAIGSMPTLISAYTIFLLHSNSSILENCTILQLICFFSITTLTMALALTPTTFVAILAGYFFSWTGLVGILISYIMASILGLLIGKGLKKWNIGYTPKPDSKFEKLLNNFGDNEFFLIAFARLSPVLPFAMTNIALSSLQLKWKNYIGGSILGMLPRTFLFFWAGKNAGDIWAFVKKPSLGGAYELIPIAFILISSLGLYWIVKKRMTEKNPSH